MTGKTTELVESRTNFLVITQKKELKGGKE